MMNHLTGDKIWKYLEDELAESERELVDAHLDACDDCQDLMVTLLEHGGPLEEDHVVYGLFEREPMLQEPEPGGGGGRGRCGAGLLGGGPVAERAGTGFGRWCDGGLGGRGAENSAGHRRAAAPAAPPPSSPPRSSHSVCHGGCRDRLHGAR